MAIKSSKRKIRQSDNRLKPLQRLSLYFFKRPRKTALLCLSLVLIGIASYTTLLKREGFPAIETPFAISQGAYLVNDAKKVDQDVARPLSEFLLRQPGVKNVQTQSQANFYVAQVSYEDNVKAEVRSSEIQAEIQKQNILPEQVTGGLEAFKFGFTQRGDDLAVSFYSKANVNSQELATKAEEAASFIRNKNLSLVEEVSIIDPFETAINPSTGKEQVQQKTFDRYAVRTADSTDVYDSVIIGFTAKEGADNLELDTQVRGAIQELKKQRSFNNYDAVVSASYAPQINAQIDELQKALLEGLIAVLVVGSIVIAVRASIITVLSMFTVIAITNALLYLFGYSLNTITLFALILGLALIVDDTIIMVEALDTQRKKRKDPNKVVEVATKKVSRAMIAATSTAALSFAPLLFAGGILGSFIRAIPVTIITALAMSLLVALVFIPLFARFLLLGKKHMGKKNAHEIADGVEARIAMFISRPMLWAKNSRKKLSLVGLTALFIGFGFIGAGGYLFQKVTFNIFPASKDANQISITLNFEPGTNINTAQEISDRADGLVKEVVGDNLVQASYLGMADARSAMLNVDLVDYKKRDIKAPEIVDKLNTRFADFEGAQVSVAQIDAGPPASAFEARVDSSQNRDSAIRLASDIGSFLETATLKRPDGSTATIDKVTPPNPSIFSRDNNNSYIEVGASFIDTDTTTLVTLAQSAVEKEFTKERIESYGLKEDAVTFNFGQEDENQESFATLAIAFPAVLLVIFVLLAFQFKSLLQPLLIFMAIPFSLFGITFGLYTTDNAFSFFAMLGFFALIGLSIKNTILLTDYANQGRASGLHPVDAAHEALAERFRPLIATSFTAIVSLIPLAITSPFWEGLAVVLIFGLFSSTFLVITVFPYYYLGAEFLRRHVSRRKGLLWISLSILIAITLSQIVVWLIILAPILSGITVSRLVTHTPLKLG